MPSIYFDLRGALGKLLTSQSLAVQQNGSPVEEKVKAKALVTLVSLKSLDFFTIVPCHGPALLSRIFVRIMNRVLHKCSKLLSH